MLAPCASDICIASATSGFNCCCSFLRQLDVEEVKRRQAALAQLQRLEAAVAARAGLGMLYCTPGLQLQPTYTRFLERLAAFAADQGPCGCVLIIYIFIYIFIYSLRVRALLQIHIQGASLDVAKDLTFAKICVPSWTSVPVGSQAHSVGDTSLSSQ